MGIAHTTPIFAGWAGLVNLTVSRIKIHDKYQIKIFINKCSYYNNINLTNVNRKNILTFL